MTIPERDWFDVNDPDTNWGLPLAEKVKEECSHIMSYNNGFLVDEHDFQNGVKYQFRFNYCPQCGKELINEK